MNLVQKIGQIVQIVSARLLLVVVHLLNTATCTVFTTLNVVKTVKPTPTSNPQGLNFKLLAKQAASRVKYMAQAHDTVTVFEFFDLSKYEVMGLCHVFDATRRSCDNGILYQYYWSVLLVHYWQ